MILDNRRARLEFIVEFGDDYDGLDWWNDKQRGQCDYQVSYEYCELEIRIRLADLARVRATRDS